MWNLPQRFRNIQSQHCNEMSRAPSTQETLSLKYFSTNNKIAMYNKIIASKSSYPPVMAVLPLQY